MEQALAAIFQVTGEAVFVAMGIFARVGAAAFLIPGIGERAVPARVRLGGALALTMILSPMIGALASAAPETPTGVVAMVGAEALSGLIIGFSFRLLIFALQIGGMIISHSISLAQMFGSGVAPEPEPTIASLLSLGGIVLMLMAGLHVELVVTFVAFYEVFPFGQFPPAADLGPWAAARVSDTFALGVTLAIPFIVVGFAYNVALGALNRAMPQLLVALVGAPFLLWMGLMVLYLVLPDRFDTWFGAYQDLLSDPLGGFR